MWSADGDDGVLLEAAARAFQLSLRELLVYELSLQP
jgi:hypothetical protein